jgi:hypothetical protein
MSSQLVVLVVTLIVPLLLILRVVNYSQVERRSRIKYLVPLGILGAVLASVRTSEIISTIGWLVLTLAFQLLLLSNASRLFRSTCDEELRAEPLVGGNLLHAWVHTWATFIAGVVPALAYHSLTQG